MATTAEILSVLTGKKVFDGHKWRVYDPGGGELADLGGVLWRGMHGALLWNAAIQADPAPGGHVYSAEHGAKRRPTAWDDIPRQQRDRHHKRLIEDDRLASDFILAILTTGLLNA